MSVFTKVTIVIGTVTETTALRKTVETIEKICSPQDVKEIIIVYPPMNVAPECKTVIDEIVAHKFEIPIYTYLQKKPFFADMNDVIKIVKGSHIIFCPSDFAFNLECIPEMIKSAAKNPDVICSTSRFLKGCSFYGYNKVRLFFNRLGQLYLRILFNTRLTDLTNAFQIVSKELFEMINFEETGFPIFLEMVLKPLRLGWKFVEIPTNCYSRTEGKSRNSFKQTAMYLKTSLHIRFMKKENILLSLDERKSVKRTAKF